MRRNMNGATIRRRAGGGLRIAPPLDRYRVTLREPGERAEQSRIGEVHNGPQLGQPVLHGGTGQRHPYRRVQCFRGLGRLGGLILDLWRLVEHHHVPCHLVQQAGVAAQETIAGDGDRAGFEVLHRAGRSGPWWRITGRYGAKRASSRSQLPTTDVGQNDQMRSDGLPAGEQRDGLQCLAQAHVIGQQCAEPERSPSTATTPRPVTGSRAASPHIFRYGCRSGRRRAAGAPARVVVFRRPPRPRRTAAVSCRPANATDSASTPDRLAGLAQPAPTSAGPRRPAVPTGRATAPAAA